MRKISIVFATFIVLIGVGAFGVVKHREGVGGITYCTVTTSKVSVGHQSAVTVLPAGIKDWAIIQQPIAATNTVTLNIGGTAVSGTGYLLASSSITVGKQELFLGEASHVPASDAVTAITNLGSTTLNVTYCR